MSSQDRIAASEEKKRHTQPNVQALAHLAKGAEPAEKKARFSNQLARTPKDLNKFEPFNGSARPQKPPSIVRGKRKAAPSVGKQGVSEKRATIAN